MRACDICGEERPRRRCERCGRMVCNRCAAWWGSSRSTYAGPITAQCIDDEICVSHMEAHQ